MSLPSSTPQRDALRRALHTSLQDVLMEVALDARQVRPTMNAATASTTTAARPATSAPRPPLNVAQAGNLNSSLLASCQPSSLAQSLGLSSPNVPTLTGSPFGGLGSEGLLLSAAAAAAETRLLDQARAALLQQRLAQEKKRLLLENSYMNLLHKQSASALPKTTALSATGLLAASLPTAAPVPPPPTVAKKNTNALEALGSSLRSKTDPYIDVSSMEDPDPQDATLRRTRGGVAEPFPEKLHRMLGEVEKEGKTDIVSFFSHGRAFGVHDIDRFIEEVMPKYFKQSKWNSFARQLNLYGFIRITTGPDAGGYYHELFLKGRPNLCYHMRRVGVPQGEDRRKFKAKNNTPEPDFYSMKAVVASGPSP